MNIHFADTSFIYLAGTKPAGRILTVRVPLGFTRRRIYAFFDTTSAKTNTISLEGDIVFLRGGSHIGSIPFLAVGGDGAPNGLGGNRSILTLTSGGGVVTANSAILTLPFLTDLGLSNVPLQPTEVSVDVDEIGLNVKNFKDGASIYAGSTGYLGCVSFR